MEIRSFILNYVSLFLLLTLTVDSLVANWTMNPIWDLLYARIQLNLFYNSHAISILSVCIAGWFLFLVRKDKLPVAVFAVLGTAAIHELSLDATDIMVFHIESGISPGYGALLFFFLGAGAFLFTTKYHKNVWVIQTVGMFAWFIILTSLPHGSTIDPTVPFGAGKDFYTWWVNAEEVLSWIIPAAVWFLPRRWFSRPSAEIPLRELFPR